MVGSCENGIHVLLMSVGNQVKVYSAQIYLMKENNPGSLKEGVLLAIGGRYDQLLREMCFASVTPFKYLSFFYYYYYVCMETLFQTHKNAPRETETYIWAIKVSMHIML